MKSSDLVHWETLPIALAPDEAYDKDGCFSGSAIEKDGKLYLMYTGNVIFDDKTYQTQCIAVSEDGIHFKKCQKNPVIDAKLLGKNGNLHDFRDPKVICFKNKFYSLIATKSELNTGQILLFESPNLIDWSFKSIFLDGTPDQGIMWECPDLFHLDNRDVLLISPIQIPKKNLSFENISSTVAFIGHVDWENGTFHAENYHEIDCGLDFYAPQTLEDDKSRRIMIAWMQMWNRTLPTHDCNHYWAGAMSLPRELSVVQNKLIQKPVTSVYHLLNKIDSFHDVVLNNGTISCQRVVCDNMHLKLIVDLKEANALTIEFAKNKRDSLIINYNVATELFTVNREFIGFSIIGDEPKQLVKRQVKIPLINSQLELEIFRDTCSIEFFINGIEAMTMTFYEKDKGKDIAFSSDGQANILECQINEVRTTSSV